MDPSTLPDLWRIVYWSSQFLTWMILPVMQSYAVAGEFTVTGKLKSSLWDNAIYYSSYLLIALILVIYIATQPGSVREVYIKTYKKKYILYLLKANTMTARLAFDLGTYQSHRCCSVQHMGTFRSGAHARLRIS